MTKFAPLKIITGEFEALSKLIAYINSREVFDWKRGGDFLQKYICVIKEFPIPDAVLSPSLRTSNNIMELLSMFDSDLIGHWKVKAAPICTESEYDLVAIFLKESRDYLKTLLDSLGAQQLVNAYNIVILGNPKLFSATFCCKCRP